MEIIRFLTVKGLEIEATLQRDSAIFKDFIEYYVLSRYGRISKFLTVDSIRNVWFRYAGF